MKMFTLNTINSQNEINNMEKKLYSRPTISETKLDNEINVLLCSVQPCDPVDVISEEPSFMNPFKWFK